MNEWHVIAPGAPVKCPNRIPAGRCERAHDRAGAETFVRIRVMRQGEHVASGSLERVCRNPECNARLEVQPCPTTMCADRAAHG